MAKNIMLVLRTGGDFKLRDVRLLASRILLTYQKEKTEIPKIFCLTDLVKKSIIQQDFTLLPLPHPEWPGWWSKMNLFSPEMEQYRPFLFLDLDTACVGSLEGILPPTGNEDKFILLQDFYYSRRSASGVMWLPAGSKKIKAVWEKWIEKPYQYMKILRGDQNFINATVSPDAQWQMIVPNKLVSFTRQRKFWLTDLPADASLICFHGHPRIYQAQTVPWVKEYIERVS